MKKKHIAALAGIAAVFAVGGSLAYFNQDLEAVNVLKSGEFDTEIVEEFRPEDGKDWKPGTTVNKDFAVKNSGNVPMVVRVSFQETWEKDDGAYVTIDTTEKEEGHGEANNKFESVWQENATDGLTDKDDSVVEKTLNLGKEWVYSDGYYYYTKTLPAGATTEYLLDDVTLSKDADLGKITVVKKYSTNPDKTVPEEDWIPFPTDESGNPISEAELSRQLKEEGKTLYHIRSDIVTDENLTGYSDAAYNLTIKAHTVQATENAVKSVFGEEAVQHALDENWDWELQ
ncbi:MAG: BsaA family SipW-dependent biofilm matrix protein [Clostridium sp.]|nr:BsaA family SipW-dependent biofilm matrix protein [Clostridium sp.]